MSLALTSSTPSASSQPEPSSSQIRKDFKQLASTLQSGDLAGAQAAYSTIQTALQTDPGASGSGVVQNDFAAVGQALEAGDVGQAQSAFTQLKTDYQASPGGQAHEDYVELSSSLASGNLAAAQSDYSNLKQVLHANPGLATTSAAEKSDFASVGQGLQAGELTQTQSAMTQLETDVQTQHLSGTAQAQKATIATGTTNSQTGPGINVYG